jgi:hypothetical protein
MVHSYLLRYFHYTEDNEEYERGKSFADFNFCFLPCFLAVRRPREQLLHGRQRGSNVVRYEAQNP